MFLLAVIIIIYNVLINHHFEQYEQEEDAPTICHESRVFVQFLVHTELISVVFSHSSQLSSIQKLC